jgi:hypothetical protein
MGKSVVDYGKTQLLSKKYAPAGVNHNDADQIARPAGDTSFSEIGVNRR